MTPSPAAWRTESVPVAGIALHLASAGRGAPVLVLHHDIGRPEPSPFDDALAGRCAVLAPSHPGYDRSSRPDWMRGVREMVELGATIINYSSDAAVLRAGYASIAAEVRRGARS